MTHSRKSKSNSTSQVPSTTTVATSPMTAEWGAAGAAEFGAGALSTAAPHAGGECAPDLYPFGSEDFWLMALATLCCVLFAGIAAGLTMGLVSLDILELRILIETDERDCRDEEERHELRRDKAYAQRVYPLVSRHHQLLVTLLLMNSAANEAMPIFLDEIVSKYFAIMLSVSFVLVFGEIMPSALCTSSLGLRISAMMAPIVMLFMVVLSPVAYPIGRLLDFLLGHSSQDEVGRYNKAQIKALLRLHMEAPTAATMGAISQVRGERLYGIDLSVSSAANVPEVMGASGAEGDGGAGAHHRALSMPIASRDLLPIEVQSESREHAASVAPTRAASGLNEEEIRMMYGALDLQQDTADDVMTPMSKVFMLSSDDVIDMDLCAEIVNHGHSRIPVYNGTDRKNIMGLLMTKKLCAVDPYSGRKVGSLGLRMAVAVSPRLSLSETLNGAYIFVSFGSLSLCSRLTLFSSELTTMWCGADLFCSCTEMQRVRSHMALVSHMPNALYEAMRKQQPIPEYAKAIGIVTILDVVQRLIREEMHDEDSFSGVKARLQHPLARKHSGLALPSRRGRQTSSTLSPIRPFEARLHQLAEQARARVRLRTITTALGPGVPGAGVSGATRSPSAAQPTNGQRRDSVLSGRTTGSESDVASSHDLLNQHLLLGGRSYE